MEYAAELVWALAVAADRLNNGYFKERRYDPETGNLENEANKVMVKQWLAKQEYSHLQESDYEQGRQIQNHFKAYLFKALSNEFSGFQNTAMRVANIEMFSSKDLLEFSVVSCLPYIARLDETRDKFKREVFASEALPVEVGEIIIGDITVLSCNYNVQYNRYKIQAKIGESFVDFWYANPLQENHEYHIKARVKAKRPDKTTQLHYVKKIRNRD